MRIDKKEDLGGCLKNNEVCRYCLGFYEELPAYIRCSKGNECGRGECCFHETDRTLMAKLKDNNRKVGITE